MCAAVLAFRIFLLPKSPDFREMAQLHLAHETDTSDSASTASGPHVDGFDTGERENCSVARSRPQQHHNNNIT